MTEQASYDKNDLGDVLAEQVKLHAEIMGMTEEEYSADIVARMEARNEEMRAQLRERASREAGAIQDA